MNEEILDQQTDLKLQKLTAEAPSTGLKGVKGRETAVRSQGGPKWQRPPEEEIEKARKEYAIHQPELTRES